MNILDYYSLLRKVEEDLKKQSEEIEKTFINADFCPKYVTLNDGEIEKNQIIFYQKVYGMIRAIISPEKKDIINIKNFTRLNSVSKKQNMILSKYFLNETTKNEKTGEDEEANILNLHNQMFYEYEDYIRKTDRAIEKTLDNYIGKNEDLNKSYLNDLNDLFNSWKGVTK